jgi:hypothetical protein
MRQPVQGGSHQMFPLTGTGIICHPFTHHQTKSKVSRPDRSW